MKGHRTLKDRMLTRLTVATRWVTGDELAAKLSTCPAAIEDALGDLVAEGLAEFKAGTGYRLHVSALCRESLRALQLEIRNSEQKNMFRRHVVGQPFGEVYRFGVAEHRPIQGLFTYDIELPMPDDGTDLTVRTANVMAMARLATTLETANA